jgi:molybdopterin-guanine dinucleotide biosynthesis protein
LISPRVDFVFKNLFGDDRSLESLQSFLFAVLKDREKDLDDIIVEGFSDLSSDKLSESQAKKSNSIIKEDVNGIFIIDPHPKKEIINDKFGILDVKFRQKLITNN